MSEFAGVISAYSELGILGLIAVLMIVIFIRMFKNNETQQKEKDNYLQQKDAQIKEQTDDVSKKLTDMLDIMKKQNEEYHENQLKMIEEERKRNEMLIERIVSGVTTHVPSAEENKKLTEINKNIDDTLKEMLLQTKADRVSLVQYHNGGKGVNKQAFLKMSMTNEQIQLDVRPFMSEFKDQFRSVLGYFTHEINEKGFCYIENPNDIIKDDIGMYEFMKNRGLQAKYGWAIHGKDGYALGFICIEYESRENINTAIVDNCFKEYYKYIEKLLNS